MSIDANQSPHDGPVPGVLLRTWHAGMASLSGTLRLLVDAVLPPRCVECGQVVEGATGFCADCWQHLEFLAGPACARCDLPLPLAQGEGALCGGCMADMPPFHRVIAPLAYGPEARTMVMRFKYGRRVALGAMMARLMAVPLLPLVEESRAANGRPPLLVPVPLHRWRLWWRGFNQAAVLADALAALLDVPVMVDGLVRVRDTGSMRGQGRAARARAVRGAFFVAAKHADSVAGRHIILVDDVFTTGATAAACSRTLLRAGAARVSIAALARALTDHAGLTEGTARPIFQEGVAGADANIG